MADLFVGHPFQFTGTSLDGTVHRIARHIGRQGLVDRGAQPADWTHCLRPLLGRPR